MHAGGAGMDGGVNPAAQTHLNPANREVFSVFPLHTARRSFNLEKQ
jgi:hypothetical protein